MEKHISWLDVKEKELEKKVLAAYSSDRVMKHVEFLTTLTRRAGTEDELKAAQYIKGKLEEYGVEADIHEFDGYISYPGNAELEILSPVQKVLPCLPRTFIEPTPPKGIEAELFLLDKAMEDDYQKADVKGKFVLMEGGHKSRRELGRIIEEMGASGQIHITPGHHG